MITITNNSKSGVAISGDRLAMFILLNKCSKTVPIETTIITLNPLSHEQKSIHIKDLKVPLFCYDTFVIRQRSEKDQHNMIVSDVDVVSELHVINNSKRNITILSQKGLNYKTDIIIPKTFNIIYNAIGVYTDEGKCVFIYEKDNKIGDVCVNYLYFNTTFNFGTSLHTLTINDSENRF